MSTDLNAKKKFRKMSVEFFTNECKQKTTWSIPETTWKNYIVDYMLPVTYNPLLKGGLNSMNNYPFDAMPCTNAR